MGRISSEYELGPGGLRPRDLFIYLFFIIIDPVAQIFLMAFLLRLARSLAYAVVL